MRRGQKLAARITLSGILFLLGLSLGCRVENDQIRSGEHSLEAEHHLVADLGHEHIANTVVRQGIDGDPYLVAWGDRVLQFRFETSAPQTEVIPRSEDWEYTNGGCAIDVDQDGIEDVVVGRGHGRQKSSPEMLWINFGEDGSVTGVHRWAELAAGNWRAPHDIQPIEFDSTGERAVVYNIGREELFLARIPEKPEEEEWERHRIGSFPLSNQSGLEVVDLSGDGQMDLISGMFWIESPANPFEEEWTFHRFNSWEESRWTGMAQLEARDMDGDGGLEIVVTEAEIPGARLAIFHPGEKIRELWEPTLIADDLYCPHSLEVSDLDDDGRPDLIVGEMTAGGWDFPKQENPRILAYQQRRPGEYESTLLSEGWGVHEMKTAPFRLGQNAVLFAADEIQLFKFPDMETHVSYWTVRTGPQP